MVKKLANLWSYDYDVRRLELDIETLQRKLRDKRAEFSKAAGERQEYVNSGGKIDPKAEKK